MRFLSLLFVALSVAPSSILAAPSPVLDKRQAPQQSSINFFKDRFSYVQVDYSNNMLRTAQAFRNEGDELNARRAERIAQTSTFIWYTGLGASAWFDPQVRNAAIAAQQRPGQRVVVPFVIYNMPDRDCGSEASVGELQFNNGGFERYKTMINNIVRVIDSYPQLDFVAVLEPDSIGNMVTNIGINRCQPVLFDQYISVYAHAIQRLQRPNVALYLDVAHSHWLGWPDNVPKTADMLEQILAKAGAGNKIRGYSTNVSNYQPYENKGTITSVNPNHDEAHYVAALGRELASRNMPANFIVDTGRSGRPEALRDGIWCNLKDAGLGPRPSPNTGSDLVDSFVWVKPPGDSDGSSIVGGNGFDTACQGPHSLQPSGAPGIWFMEYAKMLIRNANPPVEV